MAYMLDVHVVVSYRNSTSNHNDRHRQDEGRKLYLIEILHQTTTYIPEDFKIKQLYLIEILHQTTTTDTDYMNIVMLYLIEILHQTTTRE